MNPGGVADTTTTLEQNPSQGHQTVNLGQGYTSSYYAPSGENGIVNPGQGYTSYGVSSVPSTTSNGAVNVPQGYAYTSPTNTDQYGYSTNAYAGYYSGYQQQEQLPPPPPGPPPPQNQQYSQPIGAYQNTGAPISSFQNTTGSYSGPTNYSTTYYNNTADYQTNTGGYANGGYNNLGTYASYGSNQYPSYTPDPNGIHNANAVSINDSSSQNQQYYKQWADYYAQNEVSCAPGTENVSVSNTTNVPVYQVPVSSGYQPSTPYVPPWRPDSSSELPQVQTGTVAASAGQDSYQDSYWTNGTANYQNYNISAEQPQSQSSIDSISTYLTYQDNQNTTYPQPSVAYSQPNMAYQQPSIPYPTTPQVTSNCVPSLQTPPQTYMPNDTCRVSNLQIPTNPRIVSNVALGLPKTNKNVAKPAYISVSLPKVDVKVPSNEDADSILKPGMFPKSLRGYVERALARCKDDTQKEACQSVLKEIIIKATADGSIARDWDTEPLFLIPSTDVTNKDQLVSTPNFLFSKSNRSPRRRSKSRWEPISEEKPVNKVACVTPDSLKYAYFSGSDRKAAGGNVENKAFNFCSNKKFSIDNRLTNKSTQKPFKRKRYNDNIIGVDNSEVSSDSDKEQSLTKYYSSAITLAENPEEKKRREHRSKRFEKGQGKRAESNNHYKPKSDYYSRRAIAVTISKNYEDAGNRAVEDIDWDSLTVKGTSQEIEKRYLRLTSAPDPATVRPEEVLEKALLMVQNSHRNYLYKCDQLKSIRQDLTVQRIRNELTVKVYETHARLAIEAGDLSECNQCQSQLKTLYAEGIKGCHMEFSAYDLLRVISHSSNNRDLLSAMKRLSIETKRDEAVKHALAVRAAVTSGNYVLFFRLYKTAPNLNMCLMDLYVEKMRYSAVKCISRSCRPTVPVSYIAQLLGFNGSGCITDTDHENESDGLEECAEWLKSHGACLIVDNNGEMQLESKASSTTLFMPDPEDAVAHGDTTLAVNDFLAKNIS